MFQRIQTLYMFLVLIACVALFFLPIARYYSEEIYCQLSVLSISIISVTPLDIKFNTLPLIILVSGIAVLTIITLALYKKRPQQLKIGKIILMLIILLVVLLFFYADGISKVTKITSSYKLGVGIPLVMLVLQFLANRSIRKDEELVKSADRIR